MKVKIIKTTITHKLANDKLKKVPNKAVRTAKEVTTVGLACGAGWVQHLTHQKVKKESLVMMMKKRITESCFTQSSQTTNIPTQTSVHTNDNKKDDDDEEDDSKVEFYLKVGKHKKFIYF